MRNWKSTFAIALAVAAGCRDEPSTKAPKTDAAAVPAPKPVAPSESPTPPVAVADTAAVIESKRAEILGEPEFRDMTFRSALVEPFVVFQEVDESEVRKMIDWYDRRDRLMKERQADGTAKPADLEPRIRWAEKADHLAERSAVLLAELNRRFRELFAERFKLPTLEGCGRRPTVVSLWNEEHYMKATGRERPYPSASHMRGTLDPSSHRLLVYLGETFLVSDDEFRCAEGRVQKECDLSLVTDGARQLLSEYSAIHRGRPLVDGEEEEAPSAPLWFTTGFAAWLGGIEVPLDRLAAPPAADVVHERIRLDFVVTSRGDREQAQMAELTSTREMAERWTLTDLMKPLRAGDEWNRAEWLASGETRAPFFECRAWALCHFLWNYDGGKYRKQFTDFLGLFLAGEATSEKFAVEIMKRPSIADWGAVEMEYEWYWTKLLERKVGQGKYTRTWATPTTTPPEGTVEQDEEFLAWWKESHAK